MVFFSPVGDRLSLLRDKDSLQGKVRKGNAPPISWPAAALRAGMMLRTPLTEHPVPNRRLGSPCLTPSGLIGT